MKEKMFDFKAAVRDAVRQVQAERTRGKWIPNMNGDVIDSYRCSQCGAYHVAPYNFCHNCGADMREVSE